MFYEMKTKKIKKKKKSANLIEFKKCVPNILGRFAIKIHSIDEPTIQCDWYSMHDNIKRNELKFNGIVEN